MAYNSTLSTPKIEGALLASLKTKKIEYNITQDKSSNYASLAEAIAAVDDDEYKVKGIVLTFYTGTDWVSKRYNGEDASGFADEGNWIDVGGAAGGTQYLDLRKIYSDGRLNESFDDDFLNDLNKAKNSNTITVIDKIGSPCPASFNFHDNYCEINVNESAIIDGISDLSLYIDYYLFDLSKKSISFKQTGVDFTVTKSGTKCMADDGLYYEFAKPTKVESGGSGTVTKQIKPNTFYKFGEVSSLTITLAAEESGIENEYKFEFVSGSTPTTLLLPDSIKWKDGKDPTMEASKTYQVSIVNNLAVYAAF